MLIFSSDYHKAMRDIKDCVLFNLSSPIEEGIGLNNLIPPFHPMDSKDFDMFYANYIVINDLAFIDLMKIVYSLYEGKTVLILVGLNDYQVLITESLLKFIQQRYGINGNIINELEDLRFVNDSDLTVAGLYDLDQDKERFVHLTADLEYSSKTKWSGVTCFTTSLLILLH